MVAEPRASTDWEGRLLRWANLGLEVSVFYLLLSALARPRSGPGALLPTLACLGILAALAVRSLFDSTTVAVPVRHLATGLAAIAWASVVVRLSALPDYWSFDLPRGTLVFGAVFGGREGSGLQPLAFWSSLLLWWRGQALPRWEPTLDEALGRFRLACLASLVIIGLAAAADSAESGVAVQFEQASGVALFFATGLVTTGLARRREMAGGATLAPPPAERPDGSGARHTLIPLLVVLAALLVIAIAGLGADVLSHDTLAPAVELGGQLLAAVGAGIAQLFGMLGQALANLAPPPATNGTAGSAGEPPPSSPGVEVSPPEWLGLLLLVTVLVCAAAVIFMFGLLLRRLISRDSLNDFQPFEGEDLDQPGAEAAAEKGPTTVLALLVRFLQAFGLLKGRPRTASGAARHRGGRTEPAVLSVRAAYRAYLALSASHGCSRRPDETPDEFRIRFAQAYPAAEPEATLLTRLYVAARYGGQTYGAAELARMEQALASLRTKLVEEQAAAVTGR